MVATFSIYFQNFLFFSLESQPKIQKSIFSLIFVTVLHIFVHFGPFLHLK